MGKLIVELGENLIPDELPYGELSNDEKDALCADIWDELEWTAAIPGQGYGLRVTQTGFYVDGNLARVDLVQFRKVLDDADYEYELYRSDEAKPWVFDSVPVSKDQLQKL